MKLFDLSLHLVTNRSMYHKSLSLGRPLETLVEEAVKGGVTMVQLREKNCTTRELYDIALRLKSILAQYNVPLLISDRVDVAIAVDAAGVHLDQQDIPYDVTRSLLGPDKIIGLTVEDLKQVEEANAIDVDYIAVAPVFYTASIINAKSAFGIKGLIKAIEVSRHPVLAAGGINEFNIKDLSRSNVDGVAVSNAILSSKDPFSSSKCLKDNFQEYSKK